MKKFVSCIFIFLFISIVFSQEFPFGEKYFYPTEWGDIVIQEDCVIFNGVCESAKVVPGEYFDSLETKDTKYLVLYCDFDNLSFLSLVKRSNQSVGFFKNWEIYYSLDNNPKLLSSPMLHGFNVIEAESYITEKTKDGNDILYRPNGIFTINENPWAVESESPKKVIQLNTEKYRSHGFNYYPIDYIVVANGFVCADKDYLFEQNSRAKTIRITYKEISFEYILQDTANFQYIKLPQTIDPKELLTIHLEIVDSYPGTKYTDIVISGVYYVDAQLK